MGDPTYFVIDKSQDLLKIETIRSQCLVLISSLIEVFGDTATKGVLLIIERLFKKSNDGLEPIKVVEEETKTATSKKLEESEEEDQDEESLREAQEF